MGRKKAVSIKKGGANYDIEGPLLSTNLYKELNIGNLENIKKSYDENLDKTREKLDRVSKDLNDLETNHHNEEIRNIKLKEINNKKIIADNKLLQKKKDQAYNIIVKDLGGFIGSIFITIGKLISTFFIAIYYSLKLAFNSGEGILFKIICFILVVFAIAFIIMGFKSGLPSFDFSTSNNITKSIFKSDNDYNYTNINQGFITKLSNQLYSLVPNDYKYKFNSLGNSLSYITTGKNQYEDFLEPRVEIKTGRNDGIFHFIEANPDFTHCLLEPKVIKINFDENYYNNIDYNNINSKLLDNIKYPISMTIPFTSKNVNGRSKYILDVDNQTYFRSNSDFTETNVNNKIDKKHHIFTKNNDNIIFLNSFKNINYNETADIIAIYSPILLYKNYKGPIMTIIREIKEEVEKANEYKSVSKYENVYYDINIQKLYYNEDSGRIYLFTETNIPDYYGIHRLFDQTGNGYDYIFDNGNDMDDKYQPMLIYNKIYQIYQIEFFSRSILYLSKKYPETKSSITASIQFNTLKKYQRGVQFNGNKNMSILTAINNMSLMEINIENIQKEQFIFNNTTYNFNEYHQISKSEKNTVSSLYLSSNDGNNMFHGYLKYLTITTDTNNIQHYGLTSVHNTVFNITGSDGIKRALCMKVKNDRTRNGKPIEYDLFIDSNNNIYRDIDTDTIEPIKKTKFELYKLDGYDDIIKLYDQADTYNFFEPIENLDRNNRYIPNLVNHNGGFKIRFFRKSLLKLDKTMNIIKIEANINIESEKCDTNLNTGTESYECKYANDFDNIDTFMDLLATKKSSFIQLQFNDRNKYKDDLTYTIKNTIEGNNNNNLSYVAKNIERINIDLDNPSLIECLGVAHDIRTNNDFNYHRLDKDGGRGYVNKKREYIQKHAFIGFLDKLIITKRTEIKLI